MILLIQVILFLITRVYKSIGCDKSLKSFVDIGPDFAITFDDIYKYKFRPLEQHPLFRKKNLKI